MNTNSKIQKLRDLSMCCVCSGITVTIGAYDT